MVAEQKLAADRIVLAPDLTQYQQRVPARQSHYEKQAAETEGQGKSRIPEGAINS
jgi:hypothetical protein